MGELCIGVMSGTSLDGIDISLCEVDDTHCDLIIFESYPYELKEEVLEIINRDLHISKIGECDHRLGLMYAKAINDFIAKHDISKEDIKAIGLHGQTVWHAPNDKYPFTMQLGDPNIVAFHTGIDVVADFRRKDMAAGGQGAPFAPAFHAFLFGKEITAVINIGGMANISVLGEEVKGYDTGCGNVLLDSWIQKCLDKSYDENGEWARSGVLLDELLEDFLADEYFGKSYPKSTGREYFNLQWIEDKLSRHPELASGSKSKEMLKQVQHDKQQVHDDKQLQANIQRTLLELTARTIANEVQKFDRQRVVLCGGGAKNSFLIERLDSLLPSAEVVSSDELAVSSEAMESMMMAWLAYKRIHKEPVELSDITGASRDVVLGGLYAAE